MLEQSTTSSVTSSVGFFGINATSARYLRGNGRDCCDCGPVQHEDTALASALKVNEQAREVAAVKMK
jgi:hypothetical protein